MYPDMFGETDSFAKNMELVLPRPRKCIQLFMTECLASNVTFPRWYMELGGIRETVCDGDQKGSLLYTTQGDLSYYLPTQGAEKNDDSRPQLHPTKKKQDTRIYVATE